MARGSRSLGAVGFRTRLGFGLKFRVGKLEYEIIQLCNSIFCVHAGIFREPQFIGSMIHEGIYLSVILEMHSVCKSGFVTSRNRNETVTGPDQRKVRSSPNKRSHPPGSPVAPRSDLSPTTDRGPVRNKEKTMWTRRSWRKVSSSSFIVQCIQVQGYLAGFRFQKTPGHIIHCSRGVQVPKADKFQRESDTDMPLKLLGMTKNSGRYRSYSGMSTKRTI